MQIQEFFSKIEESPTLEIVVIDEDHVLVEHKQGTKPTFKVSAQAIQDHEWFDLSDYLCERRELKVLDHMTRVCGYFSKVKNWNKGKKPNENKSPNFHYFSFISVLCGLLCVNGDSLIVRLVIKKKKPLYFSF